MIKIYGVIIFLMLTLVGNASASALSPMLISRLKTGENSFATREYVEFYNNGTEAQDLSGWCLVYSSASDATKTTLGCLEAPEGYRLMLPANSYVRFATNEFVLTVPGFVPDVIFSSGISGSGGHIRILDAQKQEVDKLAWGTAISPEGRALAAHASGKVFARLATAPTVYLDSNNNYADFSEVTLESLPPSSLYEEKIQIDACSNIDGFQEFLPNGFLETSPGICVQDWCSNLDGVQENVPGNYVIEGDNYNCVSAVNYLTGSVLISEVLPNVSGTDTGREFIELYNPTATAVNLSGWRLELGPTYFKTYTFADLTIGPYSYMAFSDAQSGIVLPNSSAGLRLVAPNGSVISEMPAYDSPRDDESWMLADSLWQFSNVPSPGLVNTASIDDEVQATDGDLEECGPGKFRNPETNRCKSIDITVGLQACSEGQERNPTTNRCRATGDISSSLTPCKPGQERNPETNRCRSMLLASSSLVPCAEGQERNPETNRCKKTGVLGAATLADVKDLSGSQKAPKLSVSWILAGLVLGAAAAYGMYEWRTEVSRYFSRFMGVWPRFFRR